MIPAQTGWRIVVADRESEGAIYIPIVGWEFESERGFGKPRYEPVFPVPYAQGLVQSLHYSGLAQYALGFLSPREEPDGAWDEEATRLLDVLRG